MSPIEHKIVALRNEAREAGDVVMVVVCDIAMDELDYDEDGNLDYTSSDHTRREQAEIDAWLGKGQQEAWDACVAAIEAGQG